MRFMFMLAVMSLGSSMAFAAPEQPEKPSKEINVRFKCHFRSLEKKGVRCQAWGNVCLERTRDNVIPGVTDERGCDRDDGRLAIRCTNGFEDNDRARGFLRRNDGDLDLIIAGKDRRGDEEVIIIKDVNERDDDFRSWLKIDGTRFRGECHLKVGRDREGFEHDSSLLN